MLELCEPGKLLRGYVPRGISRGSPARDSRPFLTEELDFDAFAEEFSR